MELTVENEEDYQPNYYFKKKLASETVEKSPRPHRNRRKPERLVYEWTCRVTGEMEPDHGSENNKF